MVLAISKVADRNRLDFVIQFNSQGKLSSPILEFRVKNVKDMSGDSRSRASTRVRVIMILGDICQSWPQDCLAWFWLVVCVNSSERIP